RIYAPMSGTVVSISALEGQTLNANQITPTILRIADLDTMTVTAQVAEADIGRVQTDMPVYFTTLGQANRRWQGSVRQIQPTPDIVNEVVLFRVLVDVDNRDGVLLPDMTAQVFFVLAQARDVLTLPAAAVSNSSEAKDKGFVQVPGPSGPTQRAVETGLRNRELVEIVSGLAEGDSVLLPASGPSTTAKASESPPRRGLLGGPH
ncbi:MAG: efflux RND transporter periplasmic adaptor subunit, partial [Dokdonella sp.]